MRVLTDMPKLGEVTVHGSAGYDMVKDETSGIWSYTTPALPPTGLGGAIAHGHLP